jgi:hypothetical protein
MKTLYNTKGFESCEIENNKPVPGTNKKYCYYCQEEMIQDHNWDEMTRYNYTYCRCEKSLEEIDIKIRLDRMKKEYEHKKSILKEKLRRL